MAFLTWLSSVEVNDWSTASMSRGFGASTTISLQVTMTRWTSETGDSWQLITVAIQNRQLHLTTVVDAADNWQLLKLTAVATHNWQLLELTTVATYYWQLLQLTTNNHNWQLLQLTADSWQLLQLHVKFRRCLGQLSWYNVLSFHQLLW